MNTVEPPFGTYALPAWRVGLMRRAQAMPVSWLGRRMALLCRRFALRGWRGPVDGLAEGFRMRVHIADNVSERKFLFMPQFVDPTERSFVRERLGAGGGVFLDIGANAGIYSLTAGRVLAESGLAGGVIAVEPNPTMVRRLIDNIALNGLEGTVRVYALALSGRAGEIEFTVSDTNLGESGLGTGSGQRLRVPCETLAGLLGQAGVTGVAGMKIDVEGLEDTILMPFFRDAPASLYPGFIIIENSKHLWREDLVGELERCGYKLQKQCKMNHLYVHDVNK